MDCPICSAEIDEVQHKIAEKLSTLGYLHLDIWVKCEKCKYTPAFGRELSDVKPILWYPQKLPVWYKQKVEEAFRKHVPGYNCAFCNSTMELHKVWVNTWKQIGTFPDQKITSESPEEVVRAATFIVATGKGKVGKYCLPSGILAQYKCANWKCKYVRYLTL